MQQKKPKNFNIQFKNHTKKENTSLDHAHRV